MRLIANISTIGLASEKAGQATQISLSEVIRGLLVPTARQASFPAGPLFMSKIIYNERIVIGRIKEGEFQVDADGRIWRVMVRRGHLWSLVPTVKRRADKALMGSDDYLTVNLRHNRKSVRAMAHRIVWHHFNGPIPDGLFINHINGIRGDNRPLNLEVVTHSQNMRHAFRVLRTRSQAGERHSQHKLRDQQIVSMRCQWRKGEELASLSNRYKVSIAMVSRIVRGLSWAHIPLGPRPIYQPKQQINQMFLL